MSVPAQKCGILEKTPVGRGAVKRMKHVPFLGKLIIMGVIPLAVLGIAVGILSFRQAALVVRQSQKRVISDTINRIDININVKARQFDGFLTAVSESPETALLLQAAGAGTADRFDSRALQHFCRTTLGSFAEVKSVELYLGSSPVFPSRSQTPARLRSLYDKAGRSSGATVWMDANVHGGEKTVTLCRALMDGGEAAGLIVLELDARMFGSLVLTKQKILNYQTTFLTDRSGTVLYSDSAIHDSWLRPALEHYRGGERKFTLTADGARYYVCSQYNALTHWVTYTVIQEPALFPGAAPLKRYISLVVLGSTIFVFVCLLLLSMAIVKPLDQLKDGMRRAQDHDFKLRLENDRTDEIGALTDSFNCMLDRINTLVNQVYQQELAQKNAEIEALQAQINPHFLYNTLDSVNWMLIARGEMDISAVVVALGKLMQYSMDTARAMVSLEEEYRNVRDYLMIQKNRLEDRLEFTLELDEPLKCFPVPKLILQPLVENAIKYGIEPSLQPGHILVRTRKTDDDIQILVKDNGCGMDEAQLTFYRRLLRNDPSGQTNIGVRNVARRLQLHFGGRCGFDVSSRPGDGLSITIRIPVQEEQP